jgi:flavodoxin I
VSRRRPSGAAIVYGSTFGDTASAGRRIGERLGARLGTPVPVLDVVDADLRRLAGSELLVLGSSTYNFGDLQPDWETRLDDLRALDLHGCGVAVFGVGDQLSYPDTFVDAVGVLADVAAAAGAVLAGRWPADGYEHTASSAQRGDTFVGLALDETNQPERSLDRIDRWVESVARELALGRRVTRRPRPRRPPAPR